MVGRQELSYCEARSSISRRSISFGPPDHVAPSTGSSSMTCLPFSMIFFLVTKLILPLPLRVTVLSGTADPRFTPRWRRTGARRGLSWYGDGIEKREKEEQRKRRRRSVVCESDFGDGRLR